MDPLMPRNAQVHYGAPLLAHESLELLCALTYSHCLPPICSPTTSKHYRLPNLTKQKTLRTARKRVLDSDDGVPANKRPRMASEEPEDLTTPELSFGFEIECFLVHHEDLANRVPGNDFQMVHHLLTGGNIRLSEASQTLAIPPFSRWRLHDDGSLVQFTEEQLAMVLLTQDCRYLPPGPLVGLRDVDDTQSWWDTRMEFSSPKFPDANADASSLPAGQEGPQNASAAHRETELLMSSMSTSESFLAINKTCGLHVHVGRVDGEPMTLRALQCLAFVTVVFELEIDKLHPPHRLRCGHCISNRIAIAFLNNRERNRVLAARPHYWFDPEKWRFGQTKLLPIGEVRDVIFQTTTQVQLSQMLADDLRYGRKRRVNWKNIHYDPTQTLRTVEFRQHEGSVDPLAVIHWARFCLHLVKWAYKLSRENEDCLAKIGSWTSSRINISALLEAIELPDDTFAFYKAELVRTRGAGRLKQARRADGQWRHRKPVLS